MTESFGGMTTKVLLHFFVFLKELVRFFTHLDKVVLGNHVHVQCSDSIGSLAALSKLSSIISGNEYESCSPFQNIFLLEPSKETLLQTYFSKGQLKLVKTDDSLPTQLHALKEVLRSPLPKHLALLLKRRNSKITTS